MGLTNLFAKALVTRNKNPWLPTHNNPFIHTLHLKGTQDPLDPSPLWGEYGGGSSMKEVTTGETDRRLRDALDCHRFTGSREDELGRIREDTRVFTDVLIRVPVTAWKQARFNHSVRIMQDELTRRHEEDFQDHLLDDRTPRYVIVPEASLADDEIMCQFGLGVFLADGDDIQIGEINIKLDGQEVALPDWQSYDLGTGNRDMSSRPAALYRGQHYLLLSNDCKQSAIQLQSWPAGLDGFAVIHIDPHQPYAEWSDGAPVESNINGDLFGNDFSATFRDNRENQDQLLQVDFSLKSGLMPAQQQSTAAHTIVFTGNSSNSPRLTLTTLALPAINASAAAGISGWSLRFNSDGSLSEDATGGIALMGKTGENTLYLRQQGERRFSEHHLPLTEIPCDDAPPLELLPTTLPHYLCLLKLPVPAEFPIPTLSGAGIVVGSRPGDDEVGIALTLLNQTGSLQGNRQGMLNDMISRRFVRIYNEDEGLKVEPLSSSYPVNILDQNLTLKSSLHKSDSTVLKSGDHLQLGLYILKYEAGE